MLKMRKEKARKGREGERCTLQVNEKTLTDFGWASNEISVKSEVLRGASGKCDSAMAQVTSYPEAGTETAT